VTSSVFEDNVAQMGAVFFIYPASGNQPTQILVSKCQFKENRAEKAGSVLLANNLGIASNSTTFTIAFSGCSFEAHSTAAFQLALSHFSFSLQQCQFSKEIQLITGKLWFGNFSMSNCSAAFCQGPLILLDMTGILEVTSSNFTHISGGPVLAVTGQSVSSSFVFLSTLRLFNMTNLGSILQGILISAEYASIQLSDSELRTYTAHICGIFYIAFSDFNSTGLRVYDGTAQQNVVGIVMFGIVYMRNTLLDTMKSDGQMWTFNEISGHLDQIEFRNIIGFAVLIGDSILYSTNFMSIITSTLVIDGLKTYLINPGTPILYSSSSTFTLKNSQFSGQLGFVLIMIRSGKCKVYNTSMSFPVGKSVYQISSGGKLEVEQCSLQDTVLSGPLITPSTGSRVHVRELRLRNVTAVALSKGNNCYIRVDKAEILGCKIDALIHFSIQV